MDSLTERQVMSVGCVKGGCVLANPSASTAVLPICEFGMTGQCLSIIITSILCIFVSVLLLLLFLRPPPPPSSSFSPPPPPSSPPSSSSSSFEGDFVLLCCVNHKSRS